MASEIAHSWKWWTERVIAIVAAGGGLAAWVSMLNQSTDARGAPTPNPSPLMNQPAVSQSATTALRSELAPADIGFVDTQRGTGWGNRCWLHLRAGRFDWARAACERGLALVPARPYPRAYLVYNMGLIEVHDARPDLAREHFQESIALRPASDVAGIAEVRKSLATLEKSQ